MDIYLTPDLEEFVKNEVESGRYNSRSEVVADALRLLEDRERIRAIRLAEFNEELKRRIAALDAGERLDPAEARALLERRFAERRKKLA